MPITKKKTTKVRPKPSTLEVLDINVEDLLPDEDNPNAMNEATFDQLVEEIREQGFDEPLLVREHPTLKGKYQVGSGHHRLKAAIVLGMPTVPVIVKKWTDREQKVSLTKRNVLRGNMDKMKLRALYESLSEGRDPVQVQRELGFTDVKVFSKLIDEAKQGLAPKQQKRLEAARETIKSVDDLSSVLNKIFKDSGSELDEGYMVFSFGGKNHHYFQIDDKTDARLQSIIRECEDKGISYTDYITALVHADLDPSKLPKRKEPATTKSKGVTKKKPRRPSGSKKKG